MSVDLEHVFRKLGDRADQAVAPGPERVFSRVRGRRRRRIVVGCAGVLTFAVVAGVAALPVSRTPEVTQPPEVPSPSPIAFTGWGQEPEPIIGYGDGLGSAPDRMVRDDRRAYAQLKDKDGMLLLAAVDLVTGKPAWPVLSLGRLHPSSGYLGMDSQTLLIHTTIDSQKANAAKDVVLAVDSASGRLMWQKELDLVRELRFVQALPGVLVYSEGSKLIALDAKTGSRLWTVEETATVAAIEPWRPALETRDAPVAADRFVSVSLDARVAVREVATGRLIEERMGLPSDIIQWNPGEFIARYRVIDGVLYTFRGGTVLSMPLTGLASNARTLFQARRDARVWSVTGCGGRTLCVFETFQGGAADLVGVEADSGEQRWRLPAYVPEPGWQPTANGFLVTTLNPPSQGTDLKNRTWSSTWYALDGSVRQTFEGRFARWIDDGNVLLEQAPIPPGAPTVAKVRVDGYSIATGRRAELGEIRRRSVCAAGSVYLVCLGENGIVAYRMTR